jgi:predicted GIY-YIG superfamily endonuclease
VGKHKYIESPEKTWELPYKKDGTGNYIIIGKKREGSAITLENKKKFPDGYIYFIRLQDQNIYKLGVSQNPRRRLRDIDSYLPFDFQILSLHFFKNVYDIEERIAKTIKAKKIKREWYSLSINEAADIMVELYNLNYLEDGSA